MITGVSRLKGAGQAMLVLTKLGDSNGGLLAVYVSLGAAGICIEL